MNAHESRAPSRLLAAMAMIFMLFPLLAVIPVSFTGKRFLSMPDGNWSLRHYKALLDSPEWLSAVGQSLVVASAACVVATALAVSFALGIWYLRSRWAALLIGLVLLPMAIPPMISAMVLYFMETTVSKFAPGLGYDTLFGLTIAHIVMVVPYGVVTMLVALSQLDRRIELAARNLGASLAQTTFLVVLPNLRKGLMVALLLSFSFLFGEFVFANLLVGTRYETLQVYLNNMRNSSGHFNSALVISYFAFVLVLTWVANRLNKDKS